MIRVEVHSKGLSISTPMGYSWTVQDEIENTEEACMQVACNSILCSQSANGSSQQNLAFIGTIVPTTERISLMAVGGCTSSLRRDRREATNVVRHFSYLAAHNNSQGSGRRTMHHSMLQPPERLLFLPGASGNTSFWQPLAQRLRHRAEQQLLGWPGFGDTPSDPGVNGFQDLLALVVAQLDRPCALIAQSMGGVLALQAALVRPQWVTHLVLCATSGGLPMAGLGAENWRQNFQTAHPQLPDWFVTDTTDLSGQLPAMGQPVLLLWGDADPISPVAVGERLASLLPHARLQVIPGADHDLVLHHADRVAPLIDAHLADGLHTDARPVAQP